MTVQELWDKVYELHFTYKPNKSTERDEQRPFLTAVYAFVEAGPTNPFDEGSELNTLFLKMINAYHDMKFGSKCKCKKPIIGMSAWTICDSIDYNPYVPKQTIPSVKKRRNREIEKTLKRWNKNV